MQFQPLVLLYVQGSSLWFRYSCVLIKYTEGYWKTLEDLGIDRHGSDRYIWVALQPYTFHTVKKTKPNICWRSNFSTVVKNHIYFIACSVLLLPLGCLSRELVIRVYHNIQYKFSTLNAHQSSKHSQQF